MSNAHFAELWHWIALGLTAAVFVVLVEATAVWPARATLLLLAWEAIGVWGHYWLRQRQHAKG